LGYGDACDTRRCLQSLHGSQVYAVYVAMQPHIIPEERRMVAVLMAARFRLFL